MKTCCYRERRRLAGKQYAGTTGLSLAEKLMLLGFLLGEDKPGRRDAGASGKSAGSKK